MMFLAIKTEDGVIKGKISFCLMYAFAIRHEIADKDYSGFIETGKPEGVKNPHKPFTSEEIALLWANVGKLAFADTVLMMIYTGMRYGELLGMKAVDVHLEERYMVGGSKTTAGKNRVIPIHDKILPLVGSPDEDGGGVFAGAAPN